MQGYYSKRTGALSAWAFAAFWAALAAAAPAGAWAAPAETVLYSFTGGSDGANPSAGLIADSKGNLHGTTAFGGASGSVCGAIGCGAVFELSPGGTETVLYSFTGGSDGSDPAAGLIADSKGNFYGTTDLGGASGNGVVFKLSPGGTEAVLYSFCSLAGCSDGSGPGIGNLIADSSGNLYGTTLSGGLLDCGSGSEIVGCGVVFKLSPGGTETVLHSFTGSDGSEPNASLIADSRGNLYGTTSAGGSAGGCHAAVVVGCGVVFKLSPGGTETVLYPFTGGSDGALPSAALIADSSGNFYGTTDLGGASGNGVVFKLSPSGTETVLYSFTGGTDGANPVGNLIADSSGNLYGTTMHGGALGCRGTGCGVVFKLSPSGTETVLYTFKGGGDGALPQAGLIADSSGDLYGTTNLGGASDAGTVFKLTGTGFVPPVAFAAFSPTVMIDFGTAPDTDAFVLKSSFTLGSTSKGINPLAQPVTFQIGTLALTIPPGSFTGTVTSSAFGPFFFTGTINGVFLHAVIAPTGTKRFSFQAGAQNASLTGTVNPVPVTLSIGNNSGTASVSATLATASAAMH